MHVGADIHYDGHNVGTHQHSDHPAEVHEGHTTGIGWRRWFVSSIPTFVGLGVAALVTASLAAPPVVLVTAAMALLTSAGTHSGKFRNMLDRWAQRELTSEEDVEKKQQLEKIIRGAKEKNNLDDDFIINLIKLHKLMYKSERTELSETEHNEFNTIKESIKSTMEQVGQGDDWNELELMIDPPQIYEPTWSERQLSDIEKIEHKLEKIEHKLHMQGKFIKLANNWINTADTKLDILRDSIDEIIIKYVYPQKKTGHSATKPSSPMSSPMSPPVEKPARPVKTLNPKKG